MKVLPAKHLEYIKLYSLKWLIFVYVDFVLIEKHSIYKSID